MLSNVVARTRYAPCRAGIRAQTKISQRIGAYVRRSHHVSTGHCHASPKRSLLRRLTSAIRHVRARPILYGGVFLTPFGVQLYKTIDPSLAERYPNYVSKFDPNATMCYLIAGNVLIWLMWQLGHVGQRRGVQSLMKLEPFMKRHFLLHPDAVRSGGSLHTCWTYMFSHVSALHLVLNMYVLYSFGGLLHSAIGRDLFLAMYFGGGVLGGFAQLALKTSKPVLGASAAVLSIIAARALYNPDGDRVGHVLLPREYSIHMYQALALIVSFDVVGIARGWAVFAHGAHLAGTLFGLGVFTLLCRTVGTTEHGERLFDEMVYEGPLKDFYPYGEGIVHEEDKDRTTTVSTAKNRMMTIYD